MSFHKSRVDTIRALLAGSNAISSHQKFSTICDEWDEIKTLSSVPNLRRRHLLAVLHSTRALDDSLKIFVAQLGLHPVPTTSLGKSLFAIQDAPAGLLAGSFTMRKRFQNSIVRQRNTYMHEAGKFPAGDYEIRVLLGEMEHCVSVVLALE